MKGYTWDMIYGIFMMALILTINILLSRLFDVDIYILFFCNIITILTMIWHRLDRGEDID